MKKLLLILVTISLLLTACNAQAPVDITKYQSQLTQISAKADQALALAGENV